MRIAFIVNRFPLVSETFILNQITGLIDRGHEVDIYATHPGHDKKLNQDITKYDLLNKTYYFDFPSNKVLRIAKSIKLWIDSSAKDPHVFQQIFSSFIQRDRMISSVFSQFSLPYLATPFIGKKPYDIIHSHFGPVGFKAAQLKLLNLLDGKLVTTFHGYDVNASSQVCKPDAYKRLFEWGDLYTANTTFTANRAIKLGCPPEKIRILPVGLNTSQYVYQPRIWHPEEPLKLLTVARLVEKKGIEYSIRAVAKLVEQNPNRSIQYQIVGEGQLRPQLEGLVKELNLSQTVTFLGSRTQEELIKIYASSHIFILASVTAANGDMEGQGLVLQEAQYMGLPVISTLHNGIPDGVLDGESGFLVPERDVDSLLEKLNYLVQNPKSAMKMGEIGHRFVKEKYDVDDLNDQLVELYKSILFAPNQD